jgi:hypothetical protein
LLASLDGHVVVRTSARGDEAGTAAAEEVLRAFPAEEAS